MSDGPQRRWLLIAIAGAVVLAAALVLLVIVRGGGAKADATSAPRPVEPGSAATATSTEAPRAAAAQPNVPTTPGTTPSDPGARPDVVSDDGTVHDHRSNPAPFEGKPPDHIPSSTPVFVERAFAGNIGTLVTPIANDCAAKIPKDARGTRPIIQVQMFVTIKDGQMSVDDVETQFRDVTGEQAAVKECVKAKASAISIDASGQPDVEHYAITMPMRIPS